MDWKSRKRLLVRNEVNMLETCNICGRMKSHPLRVYDSKGKVIEGCVDKFHEGEIISPSESALWHYRKRSQKIRLLLKI